jgi:acetyl-CoA acetyltransferase
MPSEIDATSTSGLRDRYAIVGVGETAYVRGAGTTTRALATAAIRNAMADAGLRASDVDGMLSYSLMDAAQCPEVASDLGIRLDFYMDVWGGGSSTEALVGIATGVIEAGMCRTVVIYRAMNGYSQLRMGGTGWSAAPIAGDELHWKPYGGTTPEQAAMVKVAHSEHASCNPKALYKSRVTVDDVLASRWIVKPLHLLDCCVETDNAAALIVMSAERARDLRQPPALIRAVAGRVCKRRPDMHFQEGPTTEVAGRHAREILWRNAGVGPQDIDVTGAYDAFTFTALMQFEAYGFCAPGEGGGYVSDGTIRLGGRRPNNTSGGHLCEGYTHGISMVIENVRQLRHDVDDYCPPGPDGRRVHTYDYREGGCRQVRNVELTANLGWGTPWTGSAVVLRRG